MGCLTVKSTLIVANSTFSAQLPSCRGRKREPAAHNSNFSFMPSEYLGQDAVLFERNLETIQAVEQERIFGCHDQKSQQTGIPLGMGPMRSYIQGYLRPGGTNTRLITQ